MGTQQIIKEIETLPVSKRILVIESTLKSIRGKNTQNQNIVLGRENSYEAIKARLKELEILEKNWDSYGAKKINARSLNRAKIFASFLIHFMDIKIEFIAPLNNGNLQLEYKYQDCSYEVEITSNNKYLVYRYNHNIDEEFVSYEISDIFLELDCKHVPEKFNPAHANIIGEGLKRRSIRRRLRDNSIVT